MTTQNLLQLITYFKFAVHKASDSLKRKQTQLGAYIPLIGLGFRIL
jgi:hypothetical protein